MSAPEKILNSEMSKTVVLNLGSGDLDNGFERVTAQLWTAGHSRPEQFIGSLPAAPALVELYRNWQSVYQALNARQQLLSPSQQEDDDDLEIDEGGISNVSVVSFDELCQNFQEGMNAWLKSFEFLNIDRQLRTQLSPAEEIRVIIETNDELLRRLPWHRWDFFKDYPLAEIALSRPEYKRARPSQPKVTRQKVRILAILANSQGIDLEAESRFLKSLPDAETHFLVNPTRKEFNTQLWNPAGWDILFFAGHSQSEGETGRIYINDNKTNNSLTIEQLEEALKAAIDNGLRLAIFNSCDGLGLANALEKLNIPTVIVMREPVANRVAQDFFKHFLDGFAVERLPLYLSVQQARRKLQGVEDEFPGASWLPVICQNPAVEPPTWLQLGGIPPMQKHPNSPLLQDENARRLLELELAIALREDNLTRRLATRDQVKEENWDLVKHLASSRLVVTNRNESTEEETVEVVHEALIRSWGRLGHWLQIDSEFRLWQEQLRAAMRQWESSGQDEGALLQGKPLSDAEYWQQKRLMELSSGERNFIELSLALREREIKKQKRRRQLTISGLIAGLVVTSILAGVAPWRSHKSAYSKIKAIGASSEAIFASHQELDASRFAVGAGHQQGTLAGYETREYLLEKWQRRCAYSGVEGVPLQIEHIRPRAKGKANRISSEPCNLKKGTQLVEQFWAQKPEVLKRILSLTTQPLQDAAAVNATRWELYRRRAETGLHLEVGSGGLTKYNRSVRGLDKQHWIDAACIGKSTPDNLNIDGVQPIQIAAKGHKTRQQCRTDKYGFPARYCSRTKFHKGFQTGDI